MTQQITTEWLESVGCKFAARWAFDVTDWVCVAERRIVDGEQVWFRWKNYKGEYPKPRFRVKAPSVKETTP